MIIRHTLSWRIQTYFTGQLISQNYCVTLTTSFKNSESFLRHWKVFKKTYQIGKNVFPKRATSSLHKPFTLNCWCSHVSCWCVAFQVSSTIQAKETQCAKQKKKQKKRIFLKMEIVSSTKSKTDTLFSLPSTECTNFQ